MVSNKILLVFLVGFAVTLQLTWAAPNPPESYVKNNPSLEKAELPKASQIRARQIGWGPRNKGAGEECTAFAGHCGEDLYCAPCLVAACGSKKWICQ